jgi:general secretion pathway protein M
MSGTRSARQITAVAVLIGGILVSSGLAAMPWLQWHWLAIDAETQRSELVRLGKNASREADLRQENETLIVSGHSTNLLLDGDTTGIAGASLQRLINTIVLQHEGTATSLQVLPPKDEDNLVRISVSLSMSVGIDALRSIVYDIETSMPLIFIDNIVIENANTTFQAPDPHFLGPLEVTLQVSAFSAKKGQAE